MEAVAVQFNFRCQIGDVALFWMSLSISKPNFVVITQWGAEIYNYLQFRKTNVRHIIILLSVSVSTISPRYACHSAKFRRLENRYNIISLLTMV